MERFAAVAGAHFLALVIPGVDFLLIARTAISQGWRRATGVCAGVAAANALIIFAAFTGLSLIGNALVLAVVQLAGAAFLGYIAVQFLSAPKEQGPLATSGQGARTWIEALGLGLTSGLLNPKNALFYLSLAAALAGSAPGVLAGYGLWMVSVVLVWDVCVAVAFGSSRTMDRLGPLMPLVTKAAGVVLLLLASLMVLEAVSVLSA